GRNVTGVQTCALPISAEWIHDRLVERGYTTGLDREALEEVAGYFRYACYRWDKPRGEPVEFDARVLEHQMPGGMITNLVNQLREIGRASCRERGYTLG